MPVTSKTGLIPSVRKKISFDIKPRTTIDISNLVAPAPYILRPFAGIYNPYPYGCSVLCNHPADLEAKNVVKKAKDTWAIEGRALLSPEDLSAIKCEKFRKSHKRGFECVQADISDVVPEELFRRYTDTDSRPITPAPTVISLTTKHSQYSRVRRCMTPDPMLVCPHKERTLLVLDLRRSHSQETITWIGSPQGDSSVKLQATTITSRTTSSLSQAISSPKKRKQGKKSEFAITPPSAKLETQRDGKSNRSLNEKQHEGKALLLPEQAFEGQTNKSQPIFSSGNSSETEVIRRRGKKKKVKKSRQGKEGEKEFQGFPEPGETQVSTLGNESRMGSTRPSLTGLQGDANESDRPVGESENDDISSVKKESFLNETILKQLQRQLDHEVVESELNIKKKIALKEALRLAQKAKPSKQNQEIRILRKELCLPKSDPEKWLSIPRVFTRQSARFELPLDSRTLNVMTPMQYAEKYVFPSEERIVLYNHVFNIHREEFDEDEDDNSERIILGKNVICCLGDVMGRQMKAEEADDFRKLMGWSEDATIDFRTFAGVAAICERLLAHRFCSEMPSPEEDLKHHIERADFGALDYKLLHVSPDPRMTRILKGIRDL